jgi:hypothetical protein
MNEMEEMIAQAKRGLSPPKRALKIRALFVYRDIEFIS